VAGRTGSPPENRTSEATGSAEITQRHSQRAKQASSTAPRHQRLMAAGLGGGGGSDRSKSGALVGMGRGGTGTGIPATGGGCGMVARTRGLGKSPQPSASPQAELRIPRLVTSIPEVDWPTHPNPVPGGHQPSRRESTYRFPNESGRVSRARTALLARRSPLGAREASPEPSTRPSAGGEVTKGLSVRGREQGESISPICSASTIPSCIYSYMFGPERERHCRWHRVPRPHARFGQRADIHARSRLRGRRRAPIPSAGRLQGRARMAPPAANRKGPKQYGRDYLAGPRQGR